MTDAKLHVFLNSIPVWPIKPVDQNGNFIVTPKQCYSEPAWWEAYCSVCLSIQDTSYLYSDTYIAVIHDAVYNFLPSVLIDIVAFFAGKLCLDCATCGLIQKTKVKCCCQLL